MNPMSTVANTPSSQTSDESRASLQRRFTTNGLPALAPIGEQRRQSTHEGSDQSTNHSLARMSASERTARQYEELLALQRQVQAQISMIDPETRREVDEVQRLEEDITRFTSAVLTEPATPSNEQHSPMTNNTSLSAIKRYSLSTIPSISSAFPRRSSRSGSTVASPYSDSRHPGMTQASQQIPSQSIPGSERNSDLEVSDEESHTFNVNSFGAKAGANPNRNSMPVTAFDLRNQPYSMPIPPSYVTSHSARAYPHVDKDTDSARSPLRTTQKGNSSPDKTFLQLHQTDDKFPILVRRETDKGSQFPPASAVSDSSAVNPSPELPGLTDRATAARHRQSLPPSAMRQSNFGLGDLMPASKGAMSDAITAQNNTANRRSLEVKFGGLNDSKQAAAHVTSENDYPPVPMPKLLSSYSTNDIPTLKTADLAPMDQTVVQSRAMGPPSGPHERDALVSPSNLNTRTEFADANSQTVFPPHLQANVHAYGGYGLPGPSVAPPAGNYPVHNLPSPVYGGYGLQMLTNSFNSASLGPQNSQWPAQIPVYHNHAQAPNLFHGPSRTSDTNGRPGHQRRGQNAEAENARYAAIPLEALVGEIYGLCKDQHGCRFLQKKLEERNPAHLELIFKEINPHIVELMTDPFGNYLCQKLHEHANQEQRTTMIRCASPQMVKIALNQHGTRALQKMIESVDNKQQIDLIIEGLRNNVVQLIQDLNGNHVIQKCLNQLERDDAQFIYDAICPHVITVGTHRHGCCVLQRCIDHASGLQKGQIVAAVTRSAFTLVQDPFGNYVVQYILDLGEPSFSEPICCSFLGNISVLSRQKFSSNVVEKAIRIAGINTRRAMIAEMLVPIDLEKMLRDSFANYVVQTAIEYADPATKEHLLALIRPILPTIRNTPHGRRIQTKLAEYEIRRNGPGTSAMPFNVMANGMAPGQMQFPTHNNFSRPTAAYHNDSGANYAMQPSNFGDGQQEGGHGQHHHQRQQQGTMFAANPMAHQGFPRAARMPHNNVMGHY